MDVTDLMIDLLKIDKHEWIWLIVLALPAWFYYAYLTFKDQELCYNISMKIIPKVKTEEEKIKEKTTLYRNCLKAGLTHIGDDIYADEDVYPTQFYRFGFVRSVKGIKEAIKERNEGNKGSYAVQMDDFEMIIPREILSIIVNRKVEEVLKRRIKDEMINEGLTTDTPENVRLLLANTVRSRQHYHRC